MARCNQPTGQQGEGPGLTSILGHEKRKTIKKLIYWPNLQYQSTGNFIRRWIQILWPKQHIVHAQHNQAKADEIHGLLSMGWLWPNVTQSKQSNFQKDKN